MRVISGKYRAKKLFTVDNKNLRPTLGRTRETIFNMLMHSSFMPFDYDDWTEINIVDLFCGTGAMGFEALSRGARHGYFIDINSVHLSVAKKNAEHIGAIDDCVFIRGDSARPQKAKEKCHIAFIDPPYHSGLIPTTLNALYDNDWLADNAIIVLETAKEEKFELPASYELCAERIYKSTKIWFLKKL